MINSTKKLYVEFPDGNAYCYNIVKETFIQVLRHIGSEKLKKINLEVCHRPLFSETIYPGYKNYMSLVDNGLYVISQGDTSTKYMQIKSISDQLDLNLKICFVSSLLDAYNIYCKNKDDIDFLKLHTGRSRKQKKGCYIKLKIQNEKDKYFSDSNKLYYSIIEILVSDIVDNSKITYKDKLIATSKKLYDNQTYLYGYWLTVPASTKSKLKVLNTICAICNLDMKFSFVDETDSDDSFTDSNPNIPINIGENFKAKIKYIGAKKHYIVKSDNYYFIIKTSSTPLILNETITCQYINENQISLWDSNKSQLNGMVEEKLSSYADCIIWLGEHSFLKRNTQIKYDTGQDIIDDI